MSNDNMSRVKTLVHKLHTIGTQSESEEAEEIRCELDELWYHSGLTDEERKEWGKYSSELRADDERTKNILLTNNLKNNKLNLK